MEKITNIYGPDYQNIYRIFFVVHENTQKNIQNLFELNMSQKTYKI